MESFAEGRDGTRIHWSASGSGSPAVVLTDGIGCAGFIWKYLERDLARSHRVIHWNYRGHGRSERPSDLERVTMPDCVDDLFAVMDAAGERRAVLAGHSMGVQVSLEACRLAPHRVGGLVLVCGSPGHPLETFHGRRLLAIAFPHAKRLIEALPAAARFIFRTVIPTELAFQLGRWVEVNRHLVRREDLWPYLEDLAALDPGLFVRMLASASRHDTSEHLAAVAVPTLVVAGEKDTFTPMSLSLRMHETIPGSELLVLPGGSHVGPLEHPELLSLRVEKFLRTRVGSAQATCADAPADIGAAPAGPLTEARDRVA